MNRIRQSRWLELDRYTITFWVLFAWAIVYSSRGYVRSHESIYLLGTRRVFDSDFLANDLSWGTLPPTTFLFDHLLAPFWNVFDDFGIVTMGRVVTLCLLALSLASLARVMRLPPWSVVVGFMLWALWRQTLASCGRPMEGFQPKSFAYPLIFFSLSFAIRGQVLRAGLAAGLGTAFHIIVGGWACLSLFLSMLVNRKLFSIRDAGTFVLGTSPFIGPLLLVVALFHTGGVAPGEQAVMDEIYVNFSQPVCLDPDYYMNPTRWISAILILSLAPALVSIWKEQRSARTLGVFVAALSALFVAGLLANELELNWFLKLYPMQLANALPALFLMVFVLALAGKRQPKRFARLTWIAGAGAAIWMIDAEDVLTERIVEVPTRFVESLERKRPGKQGPEISSSRVEIYEWIRDETPVDSIFITPNLPEFWTYAERSQVAAFRHPPHDRAIIEWKQRLEALNGFASFGSRGSKIGGDLDRNQPRLDLDELVRIRELYGATHYLTNGPRRELASFLRHSTKGAFVYDIRSLNADSED